MGKKRTTNQSIILGGLLVLAIASLAMYMIIRRDVITDAAPDLVVAGRDEISAQITDRGVVRPARIAPISSAISSNQAKIVWLIDEGSKVVTGDVVAQFDTKPFNDSRHKAEQLYADARATYKASQKLLALQEEEEKGKIEEAQRKVEIAEIKAKNIINGSGPLKRKVLVQKLHQAKRLLAISRNELDDLETLLEKGHVSIREKDKVKDQVTTAEEQLTVARTELVNFDTYGWPQMVREAELFVSAAKSDLERVKRTAELLIQNRIAEVEKNRRKQATKLLALNRARQDIANCTISSPAGGIVLYSELPKENGRRKIQIGDSVWVGQTFMEIPDTTELIAQIRVREVDVAKLEVGMGAEIEVDAFPGRIFEGSVSSIASLAEEDKNNIGINRFPTRIMFIGSTENIHVGMSVTTKIKYKNVKNALVVPVSAIVYPNGSPVVYKVMGDTEIVTPVTIGIQNHFLAEVVAGLKAGDTIVKEPL